MQEEGEPRSAATGQRLSAEVLVRGPQGVGTAAGPKRFQRRFFLPDQAPLNAPRMHPKPESLLDGFGQLFRVERRIGGSLLRDKLHHLGGQLVPALRAALVRKQAEYAVLLKR